MVVFSPIFVAGTKITFRYDFAASLMVFDDMITDMINKKRNQIVTKLFIRGRKLNISTAFITQSHFAVEAYFRKAGHACGMTKKGIF